MFGLLDKYHMMEKEQREFVKEILMKKPVFKGKKKISLMEYVHIYAIILNDIYWSDLQPENIQSREVRNNAIEINNKFRISERFNKSQLIEIVVLFYSLFSAEVELGKGHIELFIEGLKMNKEEYKIVREFLAWG